MGEYAYLGFLFAYRMITICPASKPYVSNRPAGNLLKCSGNFRRSNLRDAMRERLGASAMGDNFRALPERMRRTQ